MAIDNVAMAQKIMLDTERVKWSSRKDLVGVILHNFDELLEACPEDNESYAPAMSEHYTKEYSLIVYSIKSKKDNSELPLGIYCESKELIVLGPIDMTIDEENSKPGETKILYKCGVSECDDDCWFKKGK